MLSLFIVDLFLYIEGWYALGQEHFYRFLLFRGWKSNLWSSVTTPLECSDVNSLKLPDRRRINNADQQRSRTWFCLNESGEEARNCQQGRESSPCNGYSAQVVKRRSSSSGTQGWFN